MILSVAGCLRHQDRDASTEDAIHVEDETELESDSTTDGDGSQGCGQELPWCSSSSPSETCGTLGDDHCANAGCGECQICDLDFSCGPPGPYGEIGGCSCAGDGRCHDLCSDDSDCGEDEECTDARWFCGYDAPMYLVRLCWPLGSPPFGH